MKVNAGLSSEPALEVLATLKADEGFTYQCHGNIKRRKKKQIHKHNDQERLSIKCGIHGPSGFRGDGLKMLMETESLCSWTKVKGQ